LNQARDAGIKLLVDYGSLNTDTETAVNALKDHPAFGGYVLTDEPPVQDFEKWDKLVRGIRKFDTEHYCYINLFPN
jgi:hypothetical protein